ncbi:MAG: aminodeoxychorismate synthase component I [Dissulfurimicrobium sp.]|uniref:aminodeoxychorismate synthase component I n=1 Tax=Dissulfurimicrobium sp. TaxID=2022436 RepID=UPI00404B08B2
MNTPYLTGFAYPFDISGVISILREQDPVVFLETGLMTNDERTTYLFQRPLKIITAYSLEDVEGLYNQIEEAISRGLYIAGWWCYELGYAMEPRLRRLLDVKRPDLPLAWLGVFDAPLIFEHGMDDGPYICYPGAESGFKINDLEIDTAKDAYVLAVSRIKEFIAAGHTYQVNYTVRGRFDFNGDPVGLYLALRARQATPYSAFIRAGKTSVLSFSPELFLRRDECDILMRPMKGTAKRGKTVQEDIEIANWLKADAKNRAENVMIVDLIRNDLGRISGSRDVRVDDFLRIERYETLFQMTSTVRSTIPQTTPWSEIFQALFPSGSVTGAPKLRTMEIISELETSPRGIYTGAIGFISPGGKAVLNVAIRTVVLNGGKGEIGIGSGITMDSNPAAEYDECLLKSKFLINCLGKTCKAMQQAPPVDFSLVETMRLDDKGYALLERHLERLLTSAHYFSFRCDIVAIKDRLFELVKDIGVGEDTHYKVRLLLERSGDFSIDYSRIELASGRAKVALSEISVDSSDIFLYHKTTFRPIYEMEHERASAKGLFDYIFINERGELTEGTITNIFLETDDGLFTPPVSCGLLNGTLRMELVESGKVAEKIMYPFDLMYARAIYAGNSVRGLVRVALEI